MYSRFIPHSFSFFVITHACGFYYPHNITCMLQGLAFFKEGYDATQQIRVDADEYMKVFIEQAIAKKYQALTEKQQAQDRLREIETIMNESKRALDKHLRASLASAEERREKEVAEKDVAIVELTQAVMDRGCDLLSARTERDEARTELERLRVEMEELKESTRSRTAFLAATEAEWNEHKEHL